MGKSKFTSEERLRIGESIYKREMTRFTAAARYDISPDTARNYLRYYKAVMNSVDSNEQNEATSAED
jgi:transposase